MNANLAAILYLVSGVLFILALRGLSSPETSRKGNTYGMIGMAIAVLTTLTTLWGQGALDPVTLGLIIAGVAVGGGVGAVIARKVPMTSMPQLVAAFHSLVGMAACLVAVAAIYTPGAYHIALPDGSVQLKSLIELSLGLAIGAITFTGSVIAFAKLNGNMGGAPILLPARHLLNILIAAAIVALVVVLVVSGGQALWAFWGVFALSLLIGVTLIIPIGGADMPVVVSMLNSYSGWAAAALGFTLENTTLIITGALVGSSGAILSYIMCKGMNRSFVSVILGGFGADAAAVIMKNASKVIIVPGYGMAVSQAQHALREMADKLKEEGVEVKYAIHPVAGRMPGHMNVLLAEANVPYDEVFELEDINSEFSTADVAFVIGANDVTNPAAKTDPTSAIFGMPILDVEKARTVLFVKRGMSSGYAGVENELFFKDNTMMLFADAKKMVEGIVKGL
jgi:H+-translocating NAD(P) transhydrogenase subunit beta